MTEESDSLPADSLTKDTISDLLSGERRRYVLSCLTEHDSLVLPDIAREVAAREQGVPLSQVSEDKMFRVYLSLHHTHIPKLVETKVVVHDQESDRVALAENADLLKQHTSLGELQDTE